MGNTRVAIASLVVPALLLAGCIEKRKPADSGSAPQRTSPAKPAAGAPASDASLQGYTRNLSEAPRIAQQTADLKVLNQAVQQFGAVEGRLPKSLDELVTGKYLARLPDAPRGSRIVYHPDTGTVTIEPAP